MEPALMYTVSPGVTWVTLDTLGGVRYLLGRAPGCHVVIFMGSDLITANKGCDNKHGFFLQENVLEGGHQ